MNEGRGRIAETTIEMVQDLDIVDVVSQYVSLKKAGVNYKGLCPFHEEKTPSFMVSPSKGIYKCFGCGKGGHTVNFVMDHDKIEYYDAVLQLAKKHDIEVQYMSGTEDGQRIRLYQMMKESMQFYQQAFKRNEQAQEYLHNRGFTEQTLKEFNIGYAQEGNKLKEFLLNKEYSLEEITKTGIIKLRKGGNNNKYQDHFDFFRENIIFPILNKNGNPIALAGRYFSAQGETTPPKKVPKYLNTDNSPLFNKSKTFFGLGTTYYKEIIRDTNTINIVEGYTDVMMFQQKGLLTLGNMGSSINSGRFKSISKHITNINLLGDPDIAGLNGIKQGLKEVTKAHYWPTIKLLPEGEDPADFAKNKEDLETAINNLETQEPLTFYIKTKEKNLRDQLEKKDKTKEEIDELITSRQYRVETAQEIMKEYIKWTQGNGNILAHLHDLEGLLDLPQESLITTHFEQHQKENKLGIEEKYVKNLKEEVLNEFLASLLITTPTYAQQFSKIIPPQHPQLNKNQQQLYQYILELKQQSNPELAIKKYVTEAGNQQAIIKRTMEEEQGGRLFKQEIMTVSSLLQQGYEQGKISSINKSFLKTTTNGFNPDVDVNAQAIKSIINNHEEKLLVQQLFDAQKTGNKEETKEIKDKLFALRMQR